MRLHQNIDSTTLTWVKSELDETLRQAQRSLLAYVEEGGDAGELRTCSHLLYQVQGTLRMVELYGAAMVAEEMEQLSKALSNGTIQDRDKAYVVLMQGIVQLPDYLERLQGGHRDVPIVLLPLLNQLRESRGEKPLPESVLFSPDLSRPLPVSAQGPEAPLTQNELSRRADTLRKLFQSALLRWLKDDNSPATIRDLTDVCEQLVPITSAEPARRLFWVAAGTLDALGKNAFPVSKQLKQALAKIEQEIKRLADGGDSAFRSNPPIELTKQLLYFVAHEGSDTGRIGEIRRVFGLSENIPSEAELAHARGSLTGHNRVLFETVTSAIKEDLLRVKDALDLQLRTPGTSPIDLGAQIEVLDRIADTLAMLGLDEPRRVVLEQHTAINNLLLSETKGNETALLDIAGALLYVEASLDNQVEHLGPGEAIPQNVAQLPSTNERKLLEVLVKEAITNFAKVRQCFVAFVETHWDHSQLTEVPRLLGDVSGALRIIDILAPSQYLTAVSRFTENELLRHHRVPNGQQMDRLADALASLEYFLEALRDRRPNRDRILEVTQESLESLGYWPLPPLSPFTVASAVTGAYESTPVAVLENFSDAVETPIRSNLATPTTADDRDVAGPQAVSVATENRVAAATTPAAAVHEAVLAPAGMVLVPGFNGPSNEEIDDEIREVFLEEFEGEIDNLGQLLIAWRADPNDTELLQSIRRVFHTLKGSGRLVGAKILGEFSWKIECVLNRVLEGTRPASPLVVSLVEHALKTLPLLHSALQGKPVYADFEGIQATAERLAAGEEVAYDLPSPLAAQADASLTEDLVDTPSGIEVLAPTSVVEVVEQLSEPADTAVFAIDALLFEILKSEVAGHLETVDAWLADCTAHYPQPVTDLLLRAVHTMNGAFAMTEVFVITHVTAPLEGFIKRLLAHHITPDAEGVTLIADAACAIRQIIAVLEFPHSQLPNFDVLATHAEALRDSLPESTQPSVPLHFDVGETEVANEALIESVALDSAPLPMHTELVPLDESLHSDSLGTQTFAVDETLAAMEPERIEFTSLATSDVVNDAVLGAADGSETQWASSAGDALEAMIAAYAAETPAVEQGVPVVDAMTADLVTQMPINESESADTETSELVLDQHALSTTETVFESVMPVSEPIFDPALASTPETGVEDDDYYGLSIAELEALTAPEAVEAVMLADEKIEIIRAPRPNVPYAKDPVDPEMALDTADLDSELLDIFLEESNDILDHADGVLASLREHVNDQELVISLQRDLHTLKGGARMAGIYVVGDLGHAMESLLESAAEGRQTLGDVGVVVLERGFDRLHDMVTRIGARKAIALPTGLIAQLEALALGNLIVNPDQQDPLHGSGEAPSTGQIHIPDALPLKPLSAPIDSLVEEDAFVSVRAPQEQVRIRADLLDQLVNYAGEVAIYRARLEQQLGAFRSNLGELNQTTTRLREQLRRLDIETEAQISARYLRENDEKDSEFDPLELDRFTNQQQLSRGLAESANDLVNLQGVLDDLTRQYETLLLQQSRVSSDLQEGLMRTRMVPFDALVPRLRRVLRQATIDTGKQVQLKVDGASGEMDRTVLERMTAPLEHMLRNAMAHGFELPEERRKAKKPEEGLVRIVVQREGSEVVLKISDDGSGLNKKAIRQKAIERGLLQADAVVSDEALYAMILENGFSTAESTDHLSGRGVGMGVVYSEIRQLGGTLIIHSIEGKGSEFIIRLPFTLAVTQAVFVKIGDTSFAVPIASVRGVGRIARAELDKQLATEKPVFTYAGEDYAIHDLGHLIGHAPAKAQDSMQMPLLLARSGDLRAAISIDQVLGSREIVVKPVGPQVNSIPGIFGATIMGDGRVVVILDVAPLVRRHNAIVRDTAPTSFVTESAIVVQHVPVVMVVDDSITMRKVTGRVLERNNMEVLTAKDGVDAVEKMAERVPDLVLLDIEMPRMDGYEVAQYMRLDPRLKSVPIIMITSRTGDKHRQRAMDIGVNRYLGKPYQENELMRNVFEMLGIMETVDG